MPIPSYQTLMLPFLESLSDEQIYRLYEIEKKLADRYQLTEEERNQLVGSGTQKLFKSRVSWAGTYLKKSNLVTQPDRGRYVITQTGLKVLKEKPLQIDDNYLKQFKSFENFYTSTNSTDTLTPETAPSTQEETPEESIERNYKIIRETLIDDISEKINEINWEQFEVLVIRLLLKMGYGGSFQDVKSALTKKGGDGGVDGIIAQDPLGLEKIYVQAKHQKEKIPVEKIRDFMGALSSHRTNKGIFIASTEFNSNVKKTAESADKKVILIDMRKLAELMIDFELGINIKSPYIIYEIDNNFFDDI